MASYVAEECASSTVVSWVSTARGIIVLGNNNKMISQGVSVQNDVEVANANGTPRKTKTMHGSECLALPKESSIRHISVQLP